jgi:hypothetical protein
MGSFLTDSKQAMSEQDKKNGKFVLADSQLFKSEFYERSSDQHPIDKPIRNSIYFRIGQSVLSAVYTLINSRYPSYPYTYPQNDQQLLYYANISGFYHTDSLMLFYYYYLIRPRGAEYFVQF